MQIAHMDVDWFKARKKELRLTDAAIGVAISRDRSIASKVITGKKPFGIQYVDGLARIFGVSKTEILRRACVAESAPAEAVAPDTITLSVENLAVFVRSVLNGGQEGPYSQDDALEIVRGLRSALEAARDISGTLDDPMRWMTFLHGYTAGTRSDLHGS